MNAGVVVRRLAWRPLGRRLPVLSGVDLCLRPGERVLLTGPSGAGKSTLLLALAGQLSAEDGELTGEVVVDGTVGLLLQDPTAAVVAARVGRDVAFGPENRALARSAIWAAVAGALRASRFPYGADRRTSALSGGESARLALAGAMALHPGLLLLDEPLAMLDAPTADQVRTAILAAAAECTLVVVDHRTGPWLPHVDRVVQLSSSGTVVGDGPPTAPLPDGALHCPQPHPVTDVRSGRVLLRAVAAYGRPLGWRSGADAPGRTPARSGPLDAHVVAGEVLLITGPSGSGKSTLLAMLAGLSPPAGGQLTAGAAWAPPDEPRPHRWTSRELAERVAWVPQLPEHALVARTVVDEVLATPRALGMAEEPARQRADALLAQLGLADLADQDPHTLSGGEQRRLGLAAALAHDPQVLLLDEPTVGQDPHTWRAVADTVSGATASGMAVVVATHDDDLLDRLRRRAATRTVALTVAERPPERQERRWPPVRACSPTALLLASVLTLVGATQVATVRGALAMVGAELLLAPLVVHGARAGLRRALPALVAATSLGASSWWLAGNDPATAVVAGARVLAVVLPGVLLSAWIDHSRLGDELAQWWRLPARPVVASVAAMQQLAELAAQWRTLDRVRHARGLGRTRRPGSRARHAAALTFALLVQTLRRSGRLAVAMDVRGFADAQRRTFAEAPRWRRGDSALLVVAATLALVPWAVG